MKIYISGPMTGVPEYNKPVFESAEIFLNKQGFLAINPHKLHENKNPKTWADYMRTDIAALCECEAIAMIPGWEKSRGARLEHMLAIELGLKVFYSYP